MSILNAVHECGWASFVCIFLGVIGSIGGLGGLALLFGSGRKSAWAVGLLSILCGGLSLVGGYVGMTMGRSATDHALNLVDPSMRDAMLKVGYAEAGQCINIAGTTSALPIVLGLLVAGVGLLAGKSRSA